MPYCEGLCAGLVLAIDFKVYLTHEVLSQKQQRQEAAAIKTTLELQGEKQNKLRRFAGSLSCLKAQKSSPSTSPI